MKRSIKLLATTLCLALLAGCSKNLLNEDPRAIITADNLLKDKQGFENALNGLYNEVRRCRAGDTYNSPNDFMMVSTVIGVDNAYANWRSGVEDPFNLWKANSNPSVANYRRVWGWLYETINAANTIVEQAEGPGINWTPADKNLILAEARAIRAWCYRHLTNLWGDVPLTLTESSGTNIRTDWERTPVAQVRAAMEQDWLFAEQYLPDVSASTGKIIKGVVQHYLAELYLSADQPAKAKTYAEKVIQNPAYKLITQRYGPNSAKPGTPFTDMFLPGNANRTNGNTEALWVIQNELNVIGGDGSTILRRYWVNRYYSIVIGTPGRSPVQVTEEYGGRGIGRFSPTRWAMTLYGSTDHRGGDFAWRYYYLANNPASLPAGYNLGDTVRINRNVNERLSNPLWPSTRKWDYANPLDINGNNNYNDIILLRLAETYLLLAEANFRLNDLTGAATAINVLRTRANATPVAPASVTIDYILDERSRELFAEEERRYALLRTRTWLARTQLRNVIAGPNVAARDTLLPIPQDVIDANLTKPMPQNPGY